MFSTLCETMSAVDRAWKAREQRLREQDEEAELYHASANSAYGKVKQLKRSKQSDIDSRFHATPAPWMSKPEGKTVVIYYGERNCAPLDATEYK